MDMTKLSEAASLPLAHLQEVSGGQDVLRKVVLSEDPSKGYRSPVSFDYIANEIDDLPPYSLWWGKLMLKNDPVVQFSLNIRDAVLMAAEVEVEAKDPRLKAWVEKQWKTMWDQYGHRLVAAKRWGYAPLQVNYVKGADGLIDVKELKDFSPEDARALESNGRICGFRLKNLKQTGVVKIMAPRALWVSFNSEYGSHYGTGTLARSFPGWFEKHHPRGAKKLLQQRMVKDAYIGDVFWYPPNVAITLPNGDLVPWRDILREIAETRLSGGQMTLPNLLSSDGKKMVDYQPPQGITGGSDIFEWNTLCDKKILQGADVSLEIIEAQENGGFSGRSIPLMVLAGTCTKELKEIVACSDRDVIRPMAWLNGFGPDPDYTIRPKNLMDSFATDTQGSSMGGGAMGGNASQGRPMFQQQQQQPQPQQGQQRFDEDAPFTAEDEIVQIGTKMARSRIKTAAEAITALAQKKTEHLTTSSLRALWEMEFVAETRRILENLRRSITSDLSASMFAGQMVGAAEVVVGVPASTVPLLTTTAGGLTPPPNLPFFLGAFFPDDEPSPLSFPALDDAVKVLQNAQVFAGQDYQETARLVQEGAFAITADLAEEQVGEFRDILVRQLAEGPSLKGFSAEVEARLKLGGALSERHIETIFRTNVHSAFSNGADKALAAPLVSDAFPYRAYFATTDRRVRETHIALENLGLNGTNIYRADDPTWDKFRPPWEFNCRCSWAPVTVEQAARKGVVEAQDWWARAQRMADERGGRAAEYVNRTAPTTRDWVAAPGFEPPQEFRRA